MKKFVPNPAPRFFWQGVLIVLPVIALAAVGLFSMRQDMRNLRPGSVRKQPLTIYTHEFRMVLRIFWPVLLSPLEFCCNQKILGQVSK